MTRHSGAGVTAVWVTSAVSLAGVVMLELSEGLPLAPIVTAAPIETRTEEVDGVDTMMIESLSPNTLGDIIDRPLFSTSRRPFVPAIEEAPALVPAPGRELPLALVGTILSGEMRLALLRHPKDGVLRLRLGQEIEGWWLDGISHDRVRLKKGDKVEWLKIRTDVLTQKDRDPKAPVDVGRSGRKEASAGLPSTDEVGEKAQ